MQLAPTYADAHYNLALAYEKIKEPRKALKHWRAYVKLDTIGPWAVHARNQIQRILQADGLKLIQGGKQVTSVLTCAGDCGAGISLAVRRDPAAHRTQSSGTQRC